MSAGPLSTPFRSTQLLRQAGHGNRRPRRPSQVQGYWRRSGARLPPRDDQHYRARHYVGLNAILQRRGAAVGLITNLGFEDVLEVARAEVPARAMYDFGYARPRPIVPRRFRRGVAGRITAEGEELVALDEEAVVSEAAALVAAGRQALAICFLHSYANSAHEERAGTLVRNSFRSCRCPCQSTLPASTASTSAR